MKRLSVGLIFSLLVIVQTSPVYTAVPAKTAQPSVWLAWIQSLATPSKAAVLKTKAYVDNKWRCLRYGENCSAVERAALGTLAAIIGAAAVKYTSRRIKQRSALREKQLQLWTAVRDGDINTVKRLLQEGVNPNVLVAGHPYKSTPLMEAKDPAIVKELLKANADPNMSRVNGGTALTSNVYSHRPEKKKIIKILLDNERFDIKAHQQGKNALLGVLHIEAFGFEDDEITKMLLDYKDKNAVEDMLNHALSYRNLTREQYDHFMRYIQGREEYKTILKSKKFPVYTLPSELRGKVFEYVTEEPLSKKQIEKITRRSKQEKNK